MKQIPIEQQIANYAKLVLVKALNITDQQPVLISAPAECVDFVRLLVKEAYAAGSCEVIVDFDDDVITREKFLHQPLSNFEKTPAFIKAKSDYLVDHNFAMIRIAANDPDSLNGIDSEKLMTQEKTLHRDLQRRIDAQMSDRLS